MGSPRPPPTSSNKALFHHRQSQLARDRGPLEHRRLALQRALNNADALYCVAVVCLPGGPSSNWGVELPGPRLSRMRGPPQAGVPDLLGQAHDRLGEPLEAAKNYDQASPSIRISPKRTATAPASWWIPIFPTRRSKASTGRWRSSRTRVTDWLNRGTLLHDMGRVDEAIESYDRAIAIDAKAPVPYLPRQRAAERRQALAGRRRRLRPRHRAACQFSQPRRISRTCLEGIGPLIDALTSLERAIGATPICRMHRGRASVLEAMGRGEEARASNDKAAEIEAAAAAKKARGRLNACCASAPSRPSASRQTGRRGGLATSSRPQCCICQSSSTWAAAQAASVSSCPWASASASSPEPVNVDRAQAPNIFDVI